LLIAKNDRQADQIGVGLESGDPNLREISRVNAAKKAVSKKSKI
jgi:hypothetical protein